MTRAEAKMLNGLSYHSASAPLVSQKPYPSVSSSHWSVKSKMETQASKLLNGLNPCSKISCLKKLCQGSKSLGHSSQ